MSDPTYSDEEVHRILARAAESETRLPVAEPQSGRWSLAEIQRVAEEAGLSPASVAAAAYAERRDAAAGTPPTMLGLPLGAAHEVPLARPLADDEWQRLVMRLRETFGARGREESYGNLRQWSNGNLRISQDVEGDVAVLRMRTVKGDGRMTLMGGLAMLLSSGAMAGLAAFAPVGGARPLATAGLLAVVGGVATLFSAVRLPIWARERRAQFEATGDFARRLTEAPRRVGDGS